MKLPSFWEDLGTVSLEITTKVFSIPSGTIKKNFPYVKHARNGLLTMGKYNDPPISQWGN
jgi:hypothetical protein